MTNVNDNETNGIHDEITLPEGDAVAKVERERDKLRAEYDKDVLVIVDELDRWKTRAVKLKAQRDEWKAKAKQAKESYFDAKSDRDAWKEKYLGAMNDTEDYKTLWQRSREGSSKVRVGQSNLEWLYEHDREAMFDMVACGDKNCCECEMSKYYPDCDLDENGTRREWLMAPHEDANDVFSGESVVTPEAVDANDGNATQDSSKSRIRKGLGYKDFPPHEPSEATKRFVAELDAEIDSRENLGSEPSTLEDFEGKGSEVDSREKLEADKLEAINGFLREHHGAISWNDELVLMSDEWLDRQDAITSRKWRDYHERKYSISGMLGQQERIAELQDQLESAHAKNRALKAHISKMQEGRHGWHIKGKELQKQVDALTQANSDYREEWHRVCAERDKLNRELLASNRERERLREQLGIAIDHAHDMIALVNVDTDEGLA